MTPTTWLLISWAALTCSVLLLNLRTARRLARDRRRAVALYTKAAETYRRGRAC